MLILRWCVCDAGVDCVVSKYRARHDMWNPFWSGMITGGWCWTDRLVSMYTQMHSYMPSHVIHMYCCVICLYITVCFCVLVFACLYWFWSLPSLSVSSSVCATVLRLDYLVYNQPAEWVVFCLGALAVRTGPGAMVMGGLGEHIMTDNSRMHDPVACFAPYIHRQMYTLTSIFCTVWTSLVYSSISPVWHQIFVHFCCCCCW